MPSNCEKILAITYNFEDWNHVSNKYPEGDSKYDIEKIVEGYAKKNISLLCLNITHKTINLYNNFVDFY